MVAADRRRQRRDRRAERGRSMDEGRSGAADRSGARAAVRIRAVQGVGHAVLLVRALSPHRPGRIRHVADGPPRRRRLHRSLRRTERRRAMRSVRWRRCWTRTPPILRPGNSRATGNIGPSALAARPEPGSLTFSDRSVGPVEELPARDARICRAHAKTRCEHWRRAARTSLARVMAAATAIWLHRLTGADDVVIGLPVAARGEAARGIPGMASNVLPLRLALHPGMTVSEVLGQTVAADSRRPAASALSARQHAPGHRRRRRRWPDAVRAEHQRHAVRLRLRLRRTPRHRAQSVSGSGRGSVDLGLRPLRWRSAADRLRCQSGAAYERRSRRPPATIPAAVDCDCGADADRPIGNLAIYWSRPSATPSCERGTTPRGAMPQTTLPELFAAQALRTPEAAAVICEDRALSYAALDAAGQPAGASSAGASASGRRRWWRSASSARRRC